MSIQRMTRIALLSAILYVSKVVLEFLPNIELVSLLVILYSLVFGWEAMLIVTVFNLFELIQWGFGTWWFSYLYVWPLLCVITMLLKKLIKEEFLIGHTADIRIQIDHQRICLDVRLHFQTVDTCRKCPRHGDLHIKIDVPAVCCTHDSAGCKGRRLCLGIETGSRRHPLPDGAAARRPDDR